LDDLKHQYIEATTLRRMAGCPRSGDININRIKVKLRYKNAVKEWNWACDTHTTCTRRSSSSSLAARELARDLLATLVSRSRELDSVMEFGRELVCDLLASWIA